MALWDEVKKNLVEWYTITSEKTTEEARIIPRRWDKFGISRDIERQFSELGSLVYVGLKTGEEGTLESDSVLELIRRIETLETELELKGEEIESIRSEYARAAAAGGEDQVVQPDADDESVTGTVITDPVLEMGSEDSAILVEPIIEAVDEPVVGEDDTEEIEKQN